MAGEPILPPDIDTVMLKLAVPVPLQMWDSPLSNELASAGLGGETAAEEEKRALIISCICEDLKVSSNRLALFALRRFDPILSQALWTRCTEGPDQIL